MTNFTSFSILSDKVQSMLNHLYEADVLFRTDVSRDELWNTYLENSPDVIFRSKKENDCSCCRNFVKNIGNVVGIINGKVVSIWDVKTGNPDYDKITRVMSELVHSKSITNIFVVPENQYGSGPTTTSYGVTFEHFHTVVPNKFIMDGKQIGTFLSNKKASIGVFKRAMQEITRDAINMYFDLLAENKVYRGTEFENNVTIFADIKRKYDELQTETEKDIFMWSLSKHNGVGVVETVHGVKNGAIGTLLEDFSNSVEVSVALDKFENVMRHYQRTTSLPTNTVVERAKIRIDELGLTSTLKRRVANVYDIPVPVVNYKRIVEPNFNNTEENVFDNIPTKSKQKHFRPGEKTPEMSLEEFIKNVIPRTKSIQLLMEQRLSRNLVALTAPLDNNAGKLFYWENRIGWSYRHGSADGGAIKERVKNSGGNVDAPLRISLLFEGRSDLDLGLYEPEIDEECYRIYYGNVRRFSPLGGQLDLDANGVDGPKEFPCENIFYRNLSELKPGHYKCYVNNYNKRDELTTFKFQVQINNEVKDYVHENKLKDCEAVNIGYFDVVDSTNIKFVSNFPEETSSNSGSVWGIKLNEFVDVNMILPSPNHWKGEAVNKGNKHMFFILEGCRPTEPVNGFFNEFVINELRDFRKVLEHIGGNAAEETSHTPMCGIGFSETLNDHFFVKVVTVSDIVSVIKVSV
jgi:hypothetical protein